MITFENQQLHTVAVSIGVVLEEKYDEEGVQLKVQLTSRERARFEANLIEAGVEVGLGGKEV